MSESWIDTQAGDRIRLSGISATGYHGVMPHERRDGQQFSADVDLHVDTRPAAEQDRLVLTVDYGALAEQVAAVLAGEPADLIETVAERIAALALSDDRVRAVDVVVHKPQAPVTVPVVDVSVAIHRDRAHLPVVQAPRGGFAAAPGYAAPESAAPESAAPGFPPMAVFPTMAEFPEPADAGFPEVEAAAFPEPELTAPAFPPMAAFPPVAFPVAPAFPPVAFPAPAPFPVDEPAIPFSELIAPSGFAEDAPPPTLAEAAPPSGFAEAAPPSGFAEDAPPPSFAPPAPAPTLAEAVPPPSFAPPAPAPEPTPTPAPARAVHDAPRDRLDLAPDGEADVVLALGSNIGGSQETLRQAVHDLAAIEGLQVLAVGPLARTAPVGGPEQPDFLNTVLLARTHLSPRALLRACQRVEERHGRARGEPWGPRTLDVDLITFANVVASADDLELPHPRANQRAFVLQPWSHLDPEAVLPGLGGGPVAALAQTAPDAAGIRWMALDWWGAEERP